MRFGATLILTAFCILVSGLPAAARQILIPRDFGTIRAAVADARNGDSIIVSNGNYVGPDNIGGPTNDRAITIPAGVTLMSFDGPAQCIIDAENSADTSGFTMAAGAKIEGFTFTRFTHNCIHIPNVQNAKVINCRFLQNANIGGQNFGSGVRLFGARDALIAHCEFIETQSGAAGGALLCNSATGTRIWDCIFSANESNRFGGALLVTNNSDADVGNCIFGGNFARIDGGGAAVTLNSRATFHNCTFLNNQAREGGGGGLYKGSSSNPTVINSIFWGNTAGTGPQLWQQNNGGGAGGTITITYCLVEGGQQGGGEWQGQNIITENPEFVEGREPLWGLNWYYLDPEFSAAVDAGSADADEVGMDTLFTNPDLSLDEGVVDLGFHYDLDSYLRVGTLQGYVINAANGNGVPGARVVTSRRIQAFTNDNGFWRIPNHKIGPVSLTITHEYYLDTLVAGLELREGQTIETEVNLLYVNFFPSQDAFTPRIEQGDTAAIQFTITNEGTGVLTYKAQTRLVGEADREPWVLRHSFNAGQAVGDDRLSGVVLVDSLFYVSGANGADSNLVYILDREGALVDSFYQFGSSTYGMKDMAWDGDLIWGSEANTVYGFTLDGQLVMQFDVQAPLNSVDNIAWDPDRQVLWLSGITTNNIVAYDRDGEPTGQTIARRGLRMYGMVYWQGDADGYGLYILNRPGGSLNKITKVNPDTGDSLFVTALNTIDGMPVAGAFIATYDLFSVVFMSMANVPANQGNDRIDIWQLSGNTSWMQLSPLEGEIQPQNIEQFTLGIYPTNFPLGRYEGQLIWENNTPEREFYMPITLTVIPPDAVSEVEALPSSFAIESVTPNPFNATTLIRFATGAPGRVELAIYDLAGRELTHLVDETMQAGRHTAVFKAQHLPSGIYLARLSSAEGVKTAKMVLVR